MHDYDFTEEDSKYKKELNSEEVLKTVINYIGKIASEKNNLEKQLMLMADMGREIIVADRCTVWLIDEMNNHLWTKVAHGLDAIKIPKDKGIVGYAITNNEEVIINDAYSDSRFDKGVDKKTGYKTKNIIVIPFENSEGKIIGAYQAINKMTKSEAFNENDLQHLMLAATYAGKELESSMLYQEIEETQKEIIFTMAEAGESRSKETGNHVKRVAEYSVIMAKGYGLSSSEVDLIKMASPMHDIGKIAIPDAILLKPGRFTDEEFEIMKTHAERGYQMLKFSTRKILKASAIIAYEHHEKWNGRGYPRGLKGEEIHLYGRITAIADVFDALGSDRVYKKAWEIERVVQLLKDERGEHFDPKLVDIFLDNFDEVLRIKDKFADEFEEVK